MGRWTVRDVALTCVTMLLAVLAGLAATTQPLLVTAAILGLILAGLAALHPRIGMTVWLLVVAFVPHWLGLEVVVYLPPLTLAGIALIPALFSGSKVRLEHADVVLFFVLLVATLVFVFAHTGATLWASMLTQWALGYAIGRRLAVRVGVEWAAQAFAWVMVGAAVFAVVEFVRDWHPFTQVFGPSRAEALWAPTLVRGGLTRSEAALGHPIALGAVLVLAIPLLALSSSGRVRRLIGVVALLAGVAVTVSRGPIVAAILTILLLAWGSRSLRFEGRLAILIMAAVLAVFGIGQIASITADDAEAVEASNEIRNSVFSGLLTDMHAFSNADNVFISQSGIVFYRGFTTVDNAFLATGLHFGYVVPGLLLLGLLWTSLGVLRRRASPAGIALAGQWPALMTVALITQYAAVTWFVVGLAVSWSAQNKRQPRPEGRESAAELQPEVERIPRTSADASTGLA